MPPMIHEVSTLSARGQVTIPKPVREAMGVDAGARLSFEVLDDRRVVLAPATAGAGVRREMVGQAVHAEAEDDEDEPYDPALGPFLGLLDKDIDAGRVRALPKDLEEFMLGLLNDPRFPPVDLDEEIVGEVPLGTLR